jgi:uncharacterized protein YbjT (DUF2867 family)
MKVLVTGATGTVGGEVVKALLQRRADVRAPAENVQQLRSRTGKGVGCRPLTNREMRYVGQNS